MNYSTLGPAQVLYWIISPYTCMKSSIYRQRKKLLFNIQSLIEGPMVFLGFAWLILLIIELIWGLPPILDYISLAIWVVFIIDFSIRFVLAPNRTSYLKQNWLTAISLIIPALRVFRLVRLLRIFRGLRGVRFIRTLSSLNRSMRSLGKTMERRGVGYVTILSLVITFGGAAGMFAIEQGHTGFENYGMALWWTAMRVITAGSEYYPITPEGRSLAFLLAIYGYAVFGYVTATIATFFVGRDAEEKNAPVAGSNEIKELKTMVASLQQHLLELKGNLKQ